MDIMLNNIIAIIRNLSFYNLVNFMKKSFLILSLFSVTLAHAGSLPVKQDEKLTAGVLVGFGSSEYHVDDKVSVVPLFLYDNNRFYLEGAEGGFYPYKDDKHWLRVGASYDRQQFTPRDANTDALKQLDKRKTSANAHISYMYISPFGGLEVKAMTDVFDRSGGQMVTLAHRGRFILADDKLTIYPKVGVTWQSKDYNQYYYGVSAEESARSGIAAYNTKDSFSPFVSVSAKYKLAGNVGLFANGRMDWLSSTQKDSPLTDDSSKSSVNIGLTYDF